MKIHREVKHVQYFTDDSSKNDILLIKERIHNEDGRSKPNLRLIENQKRRFWTTKEEYKVHNTKKEYEELYKLNEHSCTQVNLRDSILKALSGKRYDPSIIVDKNSPFLYGADISTCASTVKEYEERYKGKMTAMSLAIMDYETNVLNDEHEIICGSITFKDRVHVAVVSSFLGSIENKEQAISDMADEYLEKYIKERNLKIEVSVVDEPYEVVIKLMNSAHEWKPDILGFWNIAFDVNKMIDCLDKKYNELRDEFSELNKQKARSKDEEFIKRTNVKLKQLSKLGDKVKISNVMSDPSVPRAFRSFKFEIDDYISVTESGKRKGKHFTKKWNVVKTPASFQFIDLLPLFRLIRTTESQRSSYALDDILKSMINITKMKFDGAKGLVRIDWHKEMQCSFKLEYVIYNVFDCISPELLDEFTKDVMFSLKGILGISEICKIGNNPKHTADELHYENLKKGRVISTTGSTMVTELDKCTPSTKDWIITLPSWLMHPDVGMKIIKDHPLIETNITSHNADLDIKSAYPSSEIALNVSISTRAFEVCGMKGITTENVKRIGLNLSGIEVNAVEIAKLTHGYPDYDKQLEDFNKFIGE